MYKCFVRNWWRADPNGYQGRTPDASGRKHTLARNIDTEEEARAICQQYNDTHERGHLSRMAEYERT